MLPLEVTPRVTQVTRHTFGVSKLTLRLVISVVPRPLNETGITKGCITSRVTLYASFMQYVQYGAFSATMHALLLGLAR